MRRHRLVATDDGPALHTVEGLDDTNGLVEREGEVHGYGDVLEQG